MTQQEFEKLAKTQLTAEQYRKVERIYMAAPNVDKEQFCYEFKKYHLGESETVEEIAEVNEKMTLRIQNLNHDLEMADNEKKELRKTISELREANNELNDERNMLIGEKVDLALALLNAGLDEKAISILGHGYVISIKCSCDIELSQADKQFLAETFRK